MGLCGLLEPSLGTAALGEVSAWLFWVDKDDTACPWVLWFNLAIIHFVFNWLASVTSCMPLSSPESKSSHFMPQWHTKYFHDSALSHLRAGLVFSSLCSPMHADS